MSTGVSYNRLYMRTLLLVMLDRVGNPDQCLLQAGAGGIARSSFLVSCDMRSLANRREELLKRQTDPKSVHPQP